MGLLYIYNKMKECLKCKILKDINEFFKNKNNKDGYANLCKICQKEINKLRYDIKKNEIKLKTNKYYHANKSFLKEKIKNNNIKFKTQNPNYDKIYYEKSKEKINKYYYSWVEKNREKVNEYQRKYQKEWNKKNKHIQLWINLISRYLKINKCVKNKNTLNELKFTYNEFKENITSKFENWMSWENYGDWELHHNVPLSWFKENTPPYITNDLRNLYPLIKSENRKIKNKYIKYQIPKEYLDLIAEWIKNEYTPKFNIS